MSSSALLVGLLGGPEILVVVAVAFCVALAVSLMLVLLFRVVVEGRDTRRRLRELERQMQDVQARVGNPPPKTSP